MQRNYKVKDVFTFIFFLYGANLRHPHVKQKYPHFLEYLFISPYQHQIHHSSNTAHFNKNMGSRFAIWDWFFGTLVLSKKVKKIRFGKEKKRQGLQFYTQKFILSFQK